MVRLPSRLLRMHRAACGFVRSLLLPFLLVMPGITLAAPCLPIKAGSGLIGSWLGEIQLPNAQVQKASLEFNQDGTFVALFTQADGSDRTQLGCWLNHAGDSGYDVDYREDAGKTITPGTSYLRYPVSWLDNDEIRITYLNGQARLLAKRVPVQLNVPVSSAAVVFLRSALTEYGQLDAPAPAATSATIDAKSGVKRYSLLLTQFRSGKEANDYAAQVRQKLKGIDRYAAMLLVDKSKSGFVVKIGPFLSAEEAMQAVGIMNNALSSIRLLTE